MNPEVLVKWFFLSQGGIQIKGTKLGVAIVVALVLLIFMPASMAATEEEIEASIDAGITWLVSQQQVDGSWVDNYAPSETVATTAFALLKLTDRSRELGYEPLDPAGPYYENIIDSLDYLESQKKTKDITGDPDDKNGNGQAIYFTSLWGGHQTYNTAIALVALANLKDDMYKDYVQDIVDWFIYIQNPDGGWRYFEENKPSDNSNTGYVVLGLAYAEVAGANVGDVRTGLDSWIDYIQNDVNGDINDGGSGYTGPDEWVNSLKTGNLIFEMRFEGDSVDEERVQYALDYLERHWSDNNQDPGWRPHHYQTMYCIMKGLETYQIDYLDDEKTIDWFDEVSTAIVESQQADGSWPVDYWAGNLLSTEWALLTLEKSTPLKGSIITVSFDVKPGSCPNPINVDDKGALPVAIAGSEDFDIGEIDPSTLMLGVFNETTGEIENPIAPLRWAYENVTQPYVPENEEPCCIVTYPDGYMDLTMKFDTQELVASGLDEYVGETIYLGIFGKTIDGLEFIGKDCVRVQAAKNNVK